MMNRKGRVKLTPTGRNAWESTLERMDETEPSQAGEVQPGLEEGLGGGDKGMDALTGEGGYGGDAVEAGRDAADAEPERPLDSEIHGDPRTPEGAAYPDDAKRVDPGQKPVGESREVDEVMSEVARDRRRNT